MGAWWGAGPLQLGWLRGPLLPGVPSSCPPRWPSCHGGLVSRSSQPTRLHIPALASRGWTHCHPWGQMDPTLFWQVTGHASLCLAGGP